jgi:N-acetylmuramoyl-L-alanine amidase
MCRLITILILISGFAANAQYIRFTKAYGKRYVYLRDVAKYYGMSLVPVAKGCELRSRYSILHFTYQKRAGVINGVKVSYMNAPFLRGREPFISEHDFLLFIDPILRKAALKHTSIKTIMIDPGHGKKDSGAVGARFKEKDIVLQIARRLRSLLNAEGYKVVMTRDHDVFPSLRQRTDMCNNLKPDLFISIHCNSAASKTARGIETYCLTPAGEASSSSNKPEQATLHGNLRDKENARFGYEVQKSLLKHTHANDRGVKFARFFVLKNILTPGVLIETGFLSNKSEENLLGSSAYQQKIAQGIVNAVKRYTKDISPR